MGVPSCGIAPSITRREFANEVSLLKRFDKDGLGGNKGVGKANIRPPRKISIEEREMICLDIKKRLTSHLVRKGLDAGLEVEKF